MVDFTQVQPTFLDVRHAIILADTDNVGNALINAWQFGRS